VSSSPHPSTNRIRTKCTVRDPMFCPSVHHHRQDNPQDVME
jgi:hypothetical protein